MGGLGVWDLVWLYWFVVLVGGWFYWFGSTGSFSSCSIGCLTLVHLDPIFKSIFESFSILFLVRTLTS